MRLKINEAQDQESRLSTMEEDCLEYVGLSIYHQQVQTVNFAVS